MDMKGFQFKRLPGTKEEVKAIQALLGKDQVDLYTGKKALEEVLMTRATPSMLHIATHGFFLSDLDLSEMTEYRSNRGMAIAPKRKVKIENPLLRSGIALAGVNHALKSGGEEKTDGIVTAEKILGLRLRGTDMVVLSACQTGLGEVKTGEGVFGLRRAFAQAGTRSLVMSMWKVPDWETKELMIQFYKNIQFGKMSRCRALRQAMLKELKTVRKRYGRPYPLFWGAFVFLGEP
jgi:CHAT domain-containing protein